MRWDDVVHQDAAKRWLDRALRSGRLPHAMLFAGPEGVGKRLLAVRLAQRILCSGRALPAGLSVENKGQPRKSRAVHGAAADVPLDACGRCDDCTAVESGMHLDLQVVERTMNRLHPDAKVRRRQANELGVDVIRHFLIEPAARHPVRGQAKVFIVEEAERMNPSAENALLKTLEEPPGTSYLILLATSEDRLLPTTRSRCQLVRFGRLPDDFVRDHLAHSAEMSPDDLAYVVGLADGRPGVAVQYAAAGLAQNRDRILELLGSLAGDPLAFSKGMQDLVKSLVAAPAEETAEAAEESDSDEEESEEEDQASAERQAGDARAQRAGRRLALTLLSTAMRDILRSSLGQPLVAHPGAPYVGMLGSRWTAAGAAQSIRAIADAETELERSANVSLVFDVLGIRMARMCVRRVA